MQVKTISEQNKPLVEAQDVSLVLGSTAVLADINLSIHTGEVVSLMGANGSGKSTLVRTLLGIYKPTSGTVRLFGHSQAGSHVPYTRIGYVPQRVSAASGVPATALEVVRSGLLSRGHLLADRGPAAKRAALDALDAVGLKDRAHDHVQVFSGGQSQRVLIARALVRQPDLLFLDEPLAGIDAESRQKLTDILADLHRRGVTLVIVLHEMGELENLVTRTLYVDSGRITYDGSPDEGPQTTWFLHRDVHARQRRAGHHSPGLTGAWPHVDH
ncbi:MAG: metal ABC transporter ATP-binding protein [Actinomycetaceae bacterium]|nr:metal ABC transporter ATP-binding protein [Actinomycetaceae bacterium]MDY6083051.1 metal ABC transporter ATP-binding protein [Actinomycetaceae bacterium]